MDDGRTIDDGRWTIDDGRSQAERKLIPGWFSVYRLWSIVYGPSSIVHRLWSIVYRRPSSDVRGKRYDRFHKRANHFAGSSGYRDSGWARGRHLLAFHPQWRISCKE